MQLGRNCWSLKLFLLLLPLVGAVQQQSPDTVNSQLLTTALPNNGDISCKSIFQPSDVLAAACSSTRTGTKPDSDQPGGKNATCCTVMGSALLTRGPLVQLSAWTTFRGAGDTSNVVNDTADPCNPCRVRADPNGSAAATRADNPSKLTAPASSAADEGIAEGLEAYSCTPAPGISNTTLSRGCQPAEGANETAATTNVWDLASLADVFVVPPGGRVVLRDMRITGALLPDGSAGLPTSAFLALSAFTVSAAAAAAEGYPSGSGGDGNGGSTSAVDGSVFPPPPPLVLHNLVIDTPSCASLSQHQAFVCEIDPSPNFTVTNTYLIVHKYDTPVASITNVTLTCSDGAQIPSPCLRATVASGRQLLAALGELDDQAADDSVNMKDVYIFLDSDLIVLAPASSDDGAGRASDAQSQQLLPQLSIKAARFVLAGRGPVSTSPDQASPDTAAAVIAAASGTVLDLAGSSSLIIVTGQAFVQLCNMTLRNLPMGPTTCSRQSFLTTYIWTFSFPRFLLGATRRFLITNTVMEVPPEELALYFADMLPEESMPEELQEDLCVMGAAEMMSAIEEVSPVDVPPSRGSRAAVALLWRYTQGPGGIAKWRNVVLIPDGNGPWQCSSCGEADDDVAGLSSACATQLESPAPPALSDSNTSSQPDNVRLVCPLGASRHILQRPSICGYRPEGVCGLAVQTGNALYIYNNTFPGYTTSGQSIPYLDAFAQPVLMLMPAERLIVFWRPDMDLTSLTSSGAGFLPINDWTWKQPAVVLTPTTIMAQFIPPAVLNVSQLAGAFRLVNSSTSNASLTIRGLVLVDLPPAGFYPGPAATPPWPNSFYSSPPAPRPSTLKPTALRPPREHPHPPPVPQQSRRSALQLKVSFGGGLLRYSATRLATYMRRVAAAAAASAPAAVSRLPGSGGGRHSAAGGPSVGPQTDMRALVSQHHHNLHSTALPAHGRSRRGMQAADQQPLAAAATAPTAAPVPPTSKPSTATQGLDASLTNFTSCLWAVEFDRAASLARHNFLVSGCHNGNATAPSEDRPLGLPFVFLDDVVLVVPQPELDLLVWAWTHNSTAASTAAGLASELARMLAGSRLSEESAILLASSYSDYGTNQPATNSNGTAVGGAYPENATKAIRSLTFRTLWWCGLEGRNVTFTSWPNQEVRDVIQMDFVQLDLPVSYSSPNRSAPSAHYPPLFNPDVPSPPHTQQQPANSPMVRPSSSTQPQPPATAALPSPSAMPPGNAHHARDPGDDSDVVSWTSTSSEPGGDGRAAAESRTSSATTGIIAGSVTAGGVCLLVFVVLLAVGLRRRAIGRARGPGKVASQHHDELAPDPFQQLDAAGTAARPPAPDDIRAAPGSISRCTAIPDGCTISPSRSAVVGVGAGANTGPATMRWGCVAAPYLGLDDGDSSLSSALAPASDRTSTVSLKTLSASKGHLGDATTAGNTETHSGSGSGPSGKVHDTAARLKPRGHSSSTPTTTMPGSTKSTVPWTVKDQYLHLMNKFHEAEAVAVGVVRGGQWRDLGHPAAGPSLPPGSSGRGRASSTGDRSTHGCAHPRGLVDGTAVREDMASGAGVVANISRPGDAASGSEQPAHHLHKCALLLPPPPTPGPVTCSTRESTPAPGPAGNIPYFSNSGSGLGEDCDGARLLLLGELGRGAQGVVYRGWWKGLEVAVKSLLVQDVRSGEWQQQQQQQQQAPTGAQAVQYDAVQQAVREAAISASVSHPNVVATYAHMLNRLGEDADAGAAGQQSAAGAAPHDPKQGLHLDVWKLTLVQELCDGNSLRHCLERGTLASCRAWRPAGATRRFSTPCGDDEGLTCRSVPLRAPGSLAAAPGQASSRAPSGGPDPIPAKHTAVSTAVRTAVPTGPLPSEASVEALPMSLPRPVLMADQQAQAAGAGISRARTGSGAAAEPCRRPPPPMPATGAAGTFSRGSIRDIVSQGASSRSGRLDAAVMLSVALQAARGLAHLHSRAIVHADVSSANILLKRVPSHASQAGSPTSCSPPVKSSPRGGGGDAWASLRTGSSGAVAVGGASLDDDGPYMYGYIAKVCDFGLSGWLNRVESATHVSGPARRSSIYSAPELVRYGRSSPAGDVYAFAVVLWELAHGCPLPELLRASRPEGAPLRAWLDQQSRLDPEVAEALPPELLVWPPNTPPGLPALAVECLQQEPSARPGMAHVQERLWRLISQLEPADDR